MLEGLLKLKLNEKVDAVGNDLVTTAGKSFQLKPVYHY